MLQGSSPTIDALRPRCVAGPQRATAPRSKRALWARGGMKGGARDRRHSPWCLLLAIFLAAWAFWATPALADRLQEIQDRGHLIVGVKGDYAPFGSRDAEGALVGYDVDVARGFAEAIGVELVLVPVTSANRMQKVQRGEIDIVAATMGDTRSRRQLVTMIEPQYYGDGANVLLRDNANIGSWADLRGRTVCGLQGALWNRLARERLLLDVTAFNSTREAGQALRNEHCVGWIYDEVNLLHEIAGEEWEGYSVSLPTRFVLPWAVAVSKEEAGGRLDRLLGDTLAQWHRDGFLQSLEQKWGLPPSPFLRDARITWQEVDEAGALKCRRNEQGQWPLECREVALVTGSGIGGVSGFSLTIMEVTGLDISILYDPLDRDIFLHGLTLTALLSLITVVGSIVLGVLFGWLMHRRVPGVSHFLRGFSEFLRMTPPLLQLYIVFFGLGGVLLALGFTLDAFLVAAVVLSLYAAASNAIAFSLAADVAASTGGRRLRLTPRDVHRALMLCYAAVMGNSANIVKATGMASTLALPELVHASTSIVAEKGNADVMMNLLLICYFALVIITVQLFRRFERGKVSTP